MKYKEWLREWFDNYVEMFVKTRTKERYAQIILNHIVPNIGDYDINEITPQILQKFIAQLTHDGNLKTGAGLASNSVNAVINVVSCSLRMAYKLDVVSKCVTDKLVHPKCVERRVECFSVSEQSKIVKKILTDGPSQLIGVVICLYTGLRIGELLALTWNDIELANGTLSVTKSCHDGKLADGRFGRITETPKTRSSIRDIPLPKQLTYLLREYKKQSKCELVVSKNGVGVSTRTYQRQFAKLLDGLNIARRGFHALRHTFATRALECGMDVKTLSEILGHKNPTITLNRYAHSMLDHKKSMMNLVGKSLKDN